MGDSLRGQLLKLALFVALILLAIGAFLRYSYVDVVTVQDDAMAPTIFGGDTVLVWRTSDFDHADILLCRHPRRAGGWIIGRVIGKPGMSVSMERGQLTINRQRVDRDFRGELRVEDQQTRHVATYSWGFEPLGEVEHLFMARTDRTLALRAVDNVGGYYLLHDNRTWTGDDSRTLGPIQGAECTGRVFMRWSPGGRAPAEFTQGRLDLLR